MLSILTPILFNGFVNWVHPWRIVVGEPVFLWGEDFGAKYSAVIFEVTNDSV